MMYLYMKQCVVYKIEWKPYNYSISHLFFRVVYPKLTKTVPAFNFLERTNKNENCKTMLEEFTFVTVDGHKKIDVSVWYRTSLQTLSHTVEYTGEPKKLAHFCTPYNFVKYWSIFNFFSLSESREICNCTITKDPPAHQVHYPVKCQCLKSINCKQSDCCNNTFWECVVQQQDAPMEHMM